MAITLIPARSNGDPDRAIDLITVPIPIRI